MSNLSNSGAASPKDDAYSTGMYVSNPGGDGYRMSPRGPFSPQNDETCAKSLKPVKGMIIAVIIAIPIWLALYILLIR